MNDILLYANLSHKNVWWISSLETLLYRYHCTSLDLTSDRKYIRFTYRSYRSWLIQLDFFLLNVSELLCFFQVFYRVSQNPWMRAELFLEIYENWSTPRVRYSRYLYASFLFSRANLRAFSLPAGAPAAIVLSIYLESAGRTINFILSLRGARSGRRGNAF